MHVRQIASRWWLSARKFSSYNIPWYSVAFVRGYLAFSPSCHWPKRDEAILLVEVSDKWLILLNWSLRNLRVEVIDGIIIYLPFNTGLLASTDSFGNSPWNNTSYISSILMHFICISQVVFLKLLWVGDVWTSDWAVAVQEVYFVDTLAYSNFDAFITTIDHTSIGAPFSSLSGTTIIFSQLHLFCISLHSECRTSKSTRQPTCKGSTRSSQSPKRQTIL